MNGDLAHVSDRLPAFVNGSLAPEAIDLVNGHLLVCPACRAELAEWEVLGAATRRAFARGAVAPARVPAPVWAVIDRGATPAWSVRRRRASLVGQLIAGQLPLVRRGIWAASALTIALGCLVALVATGPTAAGMVLAALAPLVAAMGVAFVYGPENDPSLEIALSTPTPPRLVLLARLTLVYGYDLALALAATLVVAATDGGADLWPLISLWLGPMLFLSALTLLLSLLLGTATASLVAMGLWAARLVAASETGRGLDLVGGADAMSGFWRTTPLLLPLAVLLLGIALFYAPRQERLA